MDAGLQACVTHCMLGNSLLLFDVTETEAVQDKT